MGSDRARDTYNPDRQYSRVVNQQGRVVLEADDNEARRISTETLRQQAMSVIGPSGALKNAATGARGEGYRISAPDKAKRDFAIGVGTLHVGGWAVDQTEAGLTYAKQKEWADRPPAPAANKGEKELIYLRLREQEVCALEDLDLLDPALGGPDTTQRALLVRRVCGAPKVGAEGLREVDFGNAGLALDADGVSLTRTARLAFGFAAPDKAYTGPENQMIRVQGASTAPNAAQATHLVWAYNNGSALYRVDLPDKDDPSTLKLLNTPVDVMARPIAGQYIEVLLAAVELGRGSHVAAPSGLLLAIRQAFDPLTQTVRLAKPLPAHYADAKVLFARVWDGAIAVASASEAPLVDAKGAATGVTITLSDAANTATVLTPGDYWSVSVRPATPNTFYPASATESRQPEGPREWVAPLAEIDWAHERVVDLRPGFSPLTAVSNAGSCCTLSLTPADLEDEPLEAWIARLEAKGGRAMLCLAPGRYPIAEPLKLGANRSGLTIEACGGCAEILATPEDLDVFSDGLVQCNGIRELTLKGLTFVLPNATPSIAKAEDDAAEERGGAAARVEREAAATHHAIGVRLGDCADIRLERCTFVHQPMAAEHRVFGAGVLATGVVRGLEISDCIFQGAARSTLGSRYHVFGYLQAPPIADEVRALEAAARNNPTYVFGHPPPEGHVSSLDGALFQRNSFTELTGAIFAIGRIGLGRVLDNTVRRTHGGLILFATSGSTFDPNERMGEKRGLGDVLVDPPVLESAAWARALPRPWPAREAGEEDHPISLEIQARGNSVEVGGLALAVWHAGEKAGGSMIVNANSLTNNMQALPTVASIRIGRVSITGNILSNNAATRGEAFALVIAGSPHQDSIAVGGNVYEGLEEGLPQFIISDTGQGANEIGNALLRQFRRQLHLG